MRKTRTEVTVVAESERIGLTTETHSGPQGNDSIGKSLLHNNSSHRVLNSTHSAEEYPHSGRLCFSVTLTVSPLA